MIGGLGHLLPEMAGLIDLTVSLRHFGPDELCQRMVLLAPMNCRQPLPRRREIAFTNSHLGQDGRGIDVVRRFRLKQTPGFPYVAALRMGDALQQARPTPANPWFFDRRQGPSGLRKTSLGKRAPRFDNPAQTVHLSVHEAHQGPEPRMGRPFRRFYRRDGFLRPAATELIRRHEPMEQPIPVARAANHFQFLGNLRKNRKARLLKV